MEESKQRRNTPSGDFQICGSCGHANMAEQRYCGACGAELQSLVRMLRKGSLAFGEGPRIQVTFLLGVFGQQADGIEDEKTMELLRTRILGRIRLVITETGGQYDDLGYGRFGATLGAKEPTEEDPLMAVTVGLKLLRLAAVAKQVPPLRLVAVTGRIPRKSLERTQLDLDQDSLMGGHELLRMARKIVAECPPGALFVDSLTYRMIRDTHRCKRLSDVRQALSRIPVYEVQSAVSTTDAAFEPSLVGRDKELSRIMRTFARVEAGEGPTFFTLTGGLGIGKTRLLREAVSRMKEGATIFKNPRQRRRIDRWRRTPYSYFGEILRFFFDVHENEEDEVSREKLIQGLLKTRAPKAKGVPREMSHLMGLLCQVDFPGSPYLKAQDEDPAQLERRAFSVFADYLSQASSVRPIVFVLDDLYSADNSSLRMLSYLTSNLEDAQVFFICSSRQSLLVELEETADLHIPGERLVLKPLEHEAARRMIQELLPEGVRLPRKLSKRILDISEGNPYFLRESLRELTEQGLPEFIREGKLEKLEIPGSIEGILLARLSRLGPEDRDILQKAAIFGKSFWRGGVEMLYRQEADLTPGWKLRDGGLVDRSDDLEEGLERLVHLGVIQYQGRPAFDGEAQYHFVPNLLQELIYKEIPNELKAAYHRYAGQWLELMCEGKPGEMSLEIAEHFDLGEEQARAALYHLKVGQHSMQVSAINRAIEHLQKGLQHLEGSLLQQRAQGLRSLAEAYIFNGQYQEAIHKFDELLALTWKMSHRVLAAEVYTRMGWTYFLSRDFKRALEALKNGHALYQECHYARGIAMALSHMGKVYTLMGDYQKARLYLQEAMDIRRELDNPGDLAWTLNDMGNLLLEQGKLNEALEVHQEARKIRKELGKTQQIVQSMSNIAAINMMKGEYDAALSDLMLSSNLAQKIGDKLSTAIILVNIGELHLSQGDADQAAKNLERAMEIAEKLEDRLILAECYRLWGELYLEQGEGLDALDCCGSAYKLIMESGIRSALASIYRLMGEVYAALPQEVLEEKGKIGGDRAGLPPFLFGDALACFEESISIAHRHGNLREEAKSRMGLGVYEVNRGNIARGRYQLDQARGDFERVGMTRYLGEVSTLIKEVDRFQKEEEDLAPAVDIPLENVAPLPQTGNVAQTLQFRVTFDEDELGPMPTPAELPEEEAKELLKVKQDAIPEKPPRFTKPRVVSKPFFLPELEEFRRKKAEERDQAKKNKDKDKAPKPIDLLKPPPKGKYDAFVSSFGEEITAKRKMPKLDEPSSQAEAKTDAPTAKTETSQENTKSEATALKNEAPESETKAAKSEAKATKNEAPKSETKASKPDVAKVSSPSGEAKANVPRAKASPPPLRLPDPDEHTHLDPKKNKASSTTNIVPVALVTPDEVEETPLASDAKASDDATTSSSDGLARPVPEEEPIWEEQKTLKVSLPSDLANAKLSPPPGSSTQDDADKPMMFEEEEETISMLVVDVTPENQRPEEKRRQKPAKGAQAKTPGTPKKPKGQEVAVAKGDKKTPRLPPPAPLPKAATAKSPPPKSDDMAGFEAALVTEDNSAELLSRRPLPVLPKTPTVYDSQVIIAQVAEDDDVSRDWFEEGRSDRTEQFWKKQTEEREQVKEELMLEQVIEEIDQLEKPDKKK